MHYVNTSDCISMVLVATRTTTTTVSTAPVITWSARRTARVNGTATRSTSDHHVFP